MTPDTFEPVTWRLDLMIGTGIVLFFVLVAVWSTIAGRRVREYPDTGLGFLSVLTVGLSVLGLLILSLVLIPYSSDYWRIYRVQATVEKATNVLVDASGELSSKPVVELSGIDRPVHVSDPRIVQLVGKDLTFTCQIAWHWQAQDTYACSIYSIEEDS